MTREEAIEVIKDLIDTYVVCHGEEDMVAVSLDNVDVEALDMAIKALFIMPCEHCERIYKINPCYDCISRQAAIDAMWKLYYQDCKDYGCEIPECFPADRARDELEMFPSVQPKIPTIVITEHEPYMRGAE